MSNPYILPEGNVQVAFSGGRTSAYMLHQILEANGGLPDRVRVVFTNTGRELPQTLDFIQECAHRWGDDIHMLEYRAEAPWFVLVDHATASRNGEPFEAMIRKERYLPNKMVRNCTKNLKIRTAQRFLKSLGWDKWTVARGIRADEAHRIKPSVGYDTPWHPLANAGVTRRDVGDFWSKQPFDLRLPIVDGRTIGGNCDGCMLKSERALSALAADHPERHAWWERMETETGQPFSIRFSRRELREFMERQGALALTTEGVLCQADDGECMA